MKIYAYACITTGCKEYHSYDRLSVTRTVNEIVKMFEAKFFPADREKDFAIDGFDKTANLFVDVLLYSNKHRTKLHKLIDFIGNEGAIILIDTLSAFGSAEEIKKYYDIFAERNIYVLHPDYNRCSGLSEYSTACYALCPRPADEINRAYYLINTLTDDDIKDNRGRSPAEFSNGFKAAYWYYEAYQIPENIAVLMSGHLKTAFHNIAKRYEYSGDYWDDADEWGKKLNIADIPKRYGKLPDRFHELSELIATHSSPFDSLTETEQTELIDNLCIKLRIPTIHPLNYHRFVLREKFGGRGVLKMFKNPNEDLIFHFQKFVGDDYDHPLNPPNKFWDKYQRNNQPFDV